MCLLSEPADFADSADSATNAPTNDPEAVNNWIGDNVISLE